MGSPEWDLLIAPNRIGARVMANEIDADVDNLAPELLSKFYVDR